MKHTYEYTYAMRICFYGLQASTLLQRKILVYYNVGCVFVILPIIPINYDDM